MKDDQKIIPVRLDLLLYKDLRKLSYLTEMTMVDIIREGIRLKIKEAQKVLTNADITI